MQEDLTRGDHGDGLRSEVSTQDPLGPQIKNFCPVDLRPFSPIPMSSESQVRQVVERARLAQEDWERLSFGKRAHLLKLATKDMLVRRQEVLELLHDEVGKPPAEILMSEAVGPLQMVKDWVQIIRPWLRPRPLSISRLAFPGKSGTIDLLPRGVVGIIASWNYPLANFFKPVFPALLCGNSVVIKTSEFCPRTAEWFVKIIGKYVPEGVLSCVQGDGTVGEFLVRSGIDAVTFTGSFQTGKKVAAIAAEEMIPCSSELGGKDAAIVLEDCDFDRTVAGIVHWSLHNAGQACGDLERIFVEESVAEPFIQKLVFVVSALRAQSGDIRNSDVGPVAHLAQLKIVEEHVRDAIEKGAILRCGGKRTGKGLWFEPTVLDGCDSSMLVLQEPTFGPVISICRVQNSEEAIRLVNDCKYGLNASVWSRNLKRADQIARQLKVGTAFINNHAFTGAIAAAPWTGVKQSGHGIADSVFALQHYTRPRTVVIDRNRSADGWWFPMNATAEELGHSLAEAQLGKVFSALKIPFLMKQRQKTVMNFVATGLHAAKKPRELPETVQFYTPWGRLKMRLMSLGVRLIPPVSQLELRWGTLAMETIYSGGLPGSLKLLSEQDAKVFLIDFNKTVPPHTKLAFRVSLWVIGFGPILLRRRWATFDRVSARERLAILESFSLSESYLNRRVVLFLKMTGAFSHMSTNRFRDAVFKPNKIRAVENSTDKEVFLDSKEPVKNFPDLEV